MLNYQRAAIGACHPDTPKDAAQIAIANLVSDTLWADPDRVFSTTDLIDRFIPQSLVDSARGENISILQSARKRLGRLLLNIAPNVPYTTRGPEKTNRFTKATYRPWLWCAKYAPANHDLVIPTCPCCGQSLPVKLETPSTTIS